MCAPRSLAPGKPASWLIGLLLAWAYVLGAVSDVRAQGELVLLLIPHSPEPAHVELFHRIEAELRLHGFRPEVVVTSADAASDELLGAQASAQRAFAAVAIAEHTPDAVLHVWIVDARTGLTRPYKIAQRAGDEASNVVAVRAVDLLRANRSRHPSPSAEPRSSAGTAAVAGAAAPPQGPAAAAVSASSRPHAPPSAAGAQQPAGDSAQAGPGGARARAAEPAPPNQPLAAAQTPSEPGATQPAGEPAAALARRASSAPRTSSRQTAPAARRGGSGALPQRARSSRLQLAVEAVALSLARRIGWSVGPSLAAWLSLHERLRLGVVVVAPLGGAVLRTELGDASVWQQLAWAEVGATLLRARRLQLSAAAGLGVHFLQAKGHALAPLRSLNDSSWSWTASLATRADLMLSERWSIGVSVRARAFLPPVEVAVWTEAARLGLPALEGAVGLAAWL